MTCEKDPAPALPALIGLAFDRLTTDLMARLGELGYADLQRHHFLTVLRFVSADGVRPTHIARQAGVTQQAISLTVADLARRGYVERVPDPGDGRATLVRWSPKGVEAASAIEAWFARLEDQWRAAAGDAAVAGAAAVLRDYVGCER